MPAPSEDAPGFYHVIYASTAAAPLSQRELMELLKVARERNRDGGLTGMLLCRDAMFLQFLEGRRADVEQLLTRIRKDVRHRDIRILREGTLPKRLFPDWSMALRNVAGRQDHKQSGDPGQLLVEMFHELMAHA